MFISRHPVYYEMAHPSVSIIATTLTALICVTAVAETPAPGSEPSTASVSPDSQNSSGIEGTIRVSPTRGGPIRKDQEPSVAPVRNTQFVVKTGDMIVKTFTTDSDGSFQVTLPPGHYVIVREGAAPRIGRWQFEADVLAGQMTKVNWTADSGMR